MGMASRVLRLDLFGIRRPDNLVLCGSNHAISKQISDTSLTLLERTYAAVPCAWHSEMAVMEGAAASVDEGAWVEVCAEPVAASSNITAETADGETKTMLRIWTNNYDRMKK